MDCLVIRKGQKDIVISACQSRTYAGREAELLKGCEKYIAKEGYKVIGHQQLETCLREYKALGKQLYKYVEMDMPLAEYQLPVSMQAPVEVSFGFYEGAMEKLQKAVAAVEEDWVQYFMEGDSVFCGLVNGEIVSFCIVGYDEDCVLADGVQRIGSVGCVGTVPTYRERGIGLYMTALATEELKKAGCDRGFIHYTALENWYAKLGYESFLQFYM